MKTTQPTNIPFRTHHLFVAVAKHQFHHPKYGIVTARDPIRLDDAARYDLHPILLYGVSAPGIPIYWTTYSTIDSPRSLTDFLNDAWAARGGLRGMPEAVMVSQPLAAAAPSLGQALASVGVNLLVAGPKEKMLPASLRTAQIESIFPITRALGDRDKIFNDATFEPMTLARLCDECTAEYRFDSDQLTRPSIPPSPSQRQLRDEWMTQPCIPPLAMPSDGGTWSLGDWLVSWEPSVPPAGPRHLWADYRENSTWLLEGYPDATDYDSRGRTLYQAVTEAIPPRGDDDSAVPAETVDDEKAALVKALVRCLPNPPSLIAKMARTTARDLAWYMSKRMELTEHTHQLLDMLLGLRLEGPENYYGFYGPRLFTTADPRHLETLYEAISHGGDAYPFEALPAAGSKDPEWHYLIIPRFGGNPSVITVPRKARLSSRFPDLLMNYRGTIKIQPELYEDLQVFCSHARRDPVANMESMTLFNHFYNRRWPETPYW